MQTLKVVPITTSHCADLAVIFSTDTILQKEGIAPQNAISGHDIYHYFLSWAKSNAAQCYAIIADNTCIGSISLSHIDLNEKTAQIGYWIGSTYRRKGYGRSAFQKIITLAQQMGIEKVTANIAPHNEPSLALWKKYRAHLSESETLLHATLYLHHIDSSTIHDSIT